MSETKSRGGQYVHRLTDVDLAAMTCTCPVHGEGMRLRIRPRKSGESYICRTCDRGTGPNSAGTKGWKNAERRLEYRLRAYGMTVEEYRLRIEAQQNRCLLCQDELVKPFVDHCHDLGHVRGILCSRCNSGLGFFRDNPDTLRRAIRYLRKYRADPAA